MSRIRKLAVVPLLLVVLVMGLLPTSAAAVIEEGWVDSFFDVSVIDLETVQSNVGNEWYEYPQNPPENSWWNTWFYNDPPIEGGKDVILDFAYQPIDPGLPSYVEVTINWSTLNYPETGPLGLPPMPLEEQWIERLCDYGIVWEFGSESPDGITCGPFHYEDSLPINYNPEWVSIDVRGYNMQLCGGLLQHICRPVPEYSTVILMTTGVITLAGLFVWQRRPKNNKLVSAT